MINLLNNTMRCAVIIMLISLTACVTAGEGVVNAVSTIYIPTKNDFLSVSGNVAAHTMCGDFKVDSPINQNTVYHLIEDESSEATLTFSDNVSAPYAIVKCDGDTFSYEVRKYGGSKKAGTVVGVYWNEE